MQNQQDTAKSKLYCNRCGSFDLIKANRNIIAKYIFDEPRKLQCQRCEAKLNFQKIASNSPRTPPTIKRVEDTSVPAGTQSLFVNKWLLFSVGVLGGLLLCGLVMIVFLISPFSKQADAALESYSAPIMRMGEVVEDEKIVRLVKKKDVPVEIEVVLLEEPKHELLMSELIAKPEVEPTPVQTPVPNSTPAPAPAPKKNQVIESMLSDLERLIPN